MIAMEANEVGIAFGGVKAVDRVGLTVARGKILSIIGPNGAGKTTLLNVLSGIYKANKGLVLINGEDVTGLPPHRLARKGLARTFQNLQIFGQMSVIDNVMVGRHRHEDGTLLADILGLPRSHRQTAATRARAMELVRLVGLEREASSLAGNLAYGALKRLEIARALAAEPTILMLDEPAAGCNPRETAELAALIRQIANDGVAVVLVEHDMKLVMGISNDILVIVGGRPLAFGPPNAIRSDPAVISAYLGAPAREHADA